MQRPEQRQFEDRSGKLFEYFLFGDVSLKNPKYHDALRKLTENPRLGRISFEQALRLAEESQKDNPHNPSRRFLRDIREAVIKGLSQKKQAVKRVSVYSAVGTPLDVYYGIDAFVCVEGEGGKIKRITLDASLRPSKSEEDIKADILIGDVPDPEENKADYQIMLESIAQKIIRGASS